MSCSCIYTCSFYENKLCWYLKSVFARLHANPYLHQCKFPRRKATSPRFYPAADKMERVAEIPYANSLRCWNESLVLLWVVYIVYLSERSTSAYALSRRTVKPSVTSHLLPPPQQPEDDRMKEVEYFYDFMKFLKLI